jgi:hypothetical protein
LQVALLSFQLLPLLFYKLPYELLFVYLVLSLCSRLDCFLLHDIDGEVVPVLDEFILDVLVHHVESILHIVLGSPRHFLDDFGPLVTNGKPLFKNQYILRKAEWVFFYFRVQEVNPSLPALLSISGHAEVLIKLTSNLTPLLGTRLPDEPDQLFVFSFDPITFLDG